MENKCFYVKYLHNQPVAVETHLIGQQDRRRPLTDVAQLIAAFFPDTPLNELGQYSLHLPDGIDRTVLPQDCFSSIDTTLDVGCLLSDLGSIGTKSKQPFILRSNQGTDIPPPFNPKEYEIKQKILFPFFYSNIEGYLKYFGDRALVARDDAVKQVNTILQSGRNEKYRPIICSSSRGMGKTTFIEAIGMQLVKPELKHQPIVDALACGRILSFDFAGSDAQGAVLTQKDIRTFFTRLMIYFLCHIFDGTQVDGIHFQKIGFRTIPEFTGKQQKFTNWKNDCLQFEADAMIDEYIRLTDIAFGKKCRSRPVFLLDEVQQLYKETTVQFILPDRKVVHHSYLSLLLTELSGKHNPVCICTGTNIGNIIHDKSRIIPQFVSLTNLHKKEEPTNRL